MIVDADYELPVVFNVTKASTSEIPEGKQLIDHLGKEHPDIMERCEFFLGDRGYDDTETIEILWDDYEIKPVIDIEEFMERQTRDKDV